MSLCCLSGWGARMLRRRRVSSASLLPAVIASLMLVPSAFAQTTVVLSTPDSQVIDTMLRNGPYATQSQDGALLLTRSSSVPEWERRTIVSFNTATVPVSTPITSAILTLTLKSGLGNAGATRPVGVYRLVSPFVEAQATWRDRQSGVAWQPAGGDIAETVASGYVTNVAGSKISFDVTALAQRAVNGEFERQVRMALIDIGGGGDAKESFREYHSSEASAAANRPQLTIRYGSTSGSGTVVEVPAGGNLQAALDQIAPGGTIRLASGATYVGNFRLPAKSGTSYVTITTGGASLPPAGTRIDPSYKPGLATLRSPNGTAALRTNAGASYYRIVGINFAPTLNGDGDIITLGSDGQTSMSQVPHHIELDRVIVTGDAAVGQRRGISVQATHVSILNSDIRDIKRSGGEESQAIAAWNTPGPIEIRNNRLEAAAENILIGGAHVNLPNVNPSDIVIEQNLLTKNLSWRGSKWTVKNLLELKTGKRVRIRGNTLEYSWVSAQTGYAIVLTPRNTGGRMPWGTIEDVEISSNVIRHASGAFNISGRDDTAHSGQLARLLIKDNLVYDIHGGTWGGAGTFVQMGGEPRDITIDHNTVLHTGNVVTIYSGGYISASGARVTGGPIIGFTYTNNLSKHNGYGIFGSGKSIGNGSLAFYTPGAVVRRNVFAADSSFASYYPAENYFPKVAPFYAGFVNADARDYHLVSSSPYIGAGTDGKDLGCQLP